VLTMNSVKILHAVRSAITATAELLVFIFGCWLLPEKFRVCPKSNGFVRLRGLQPAAPGSYAFVDVRPIIR